MNFVNEAGAYVYFFASRNSLDYQFIDIFEYSLRIQYLKQMLSSESPIQELIKEEMIFLPPNFEENDFSTEEEQELSNSPTNSETKENSTKYRIDKDNGCIEFLTPSKGVLKEKWIFHQYDKDYFPSIPHGHLNNNESIKLDAYRGFTYEKKKLLIKRETKRYIIDLWNNPKFRIHAINAIDYYLNHFTSFNWRVKNPKKLPKFR